MSRIFFVGERSVSSLADRHAVDNRIGSEEVLRDRRYLARPVLEAIGGVLGPFTPDSVDRGQAVERTQRVSSRLAADDRNNREIDDPRQRPSSASVQGRPMAPDNSSNWRRGLSYLAEPPGGQLIHIDGRLHSSG